MRPKRRAKGGGIDRVVAGLQQGRGAEEGRGVRLGALERQDGSGWDGRACQEEGDIHVRCAMGDIRDELEHAPRSPVGSPPSPARR